MALAYGLIESINDNEDIHVEENSDSEPENVNSSKEKEHFNKNFNFRITDDEEEMEKEEQTKSLSSLDLKIQAKLLKLEKKKKTKASDKKLNNEYGDEDKEMTDDDEADQEDTSAEDDRVREKPSKRTKKEQRLLKQKIEQEEENDKILYGKVVGSAYEMDDFSSMELSRPLMRALSHLGWSKPTPIQSSTIPVALMGTDICACAATGTGKTGAFMLPILERLLHKPDRASTTRVLVLTPTRELAVQIYQVSKQLASFTKVSFSLAAGGLDRGSQEAALRLGPDVVVATLGRLIDHLHNAPNFNLNTIEILVLDEADRMLDEYFGKQMKEIIDRCSVVRQTMLFSATMTEKVNDLAFLSLKNPTRIFVNENQEVALNLQQEFVRIRGNHETDREAIVAALVKRTFQQRTIIFIETKKLAHRLHILLGLLGLNVAQLHGNLSQTQRLEALEAFKEARVDVLVATDLVGRGLDIDGIKTVINMNMPASLERYIHRVGRTARAGKSGRSITLVGDGERRLFEKAVKASKVPVKSRTIPAEVISKYRNKLKRLEKEVAEIEAEEELEKESRVAELKANKALKMVQHSKEILARPKRTWFQSHQDRVSERRALMENLKKKKTKGDEDFK